MGFPVPMPEPVTPPWSWLPPLPVPPPWSWPPSTSVPVVVTWRPPPPSWASVWVGWVWLWPPPVEMLWLWLPPDETLWVWPGPRLPVAAPSFDPSETWVPVPKMVRSRRSGILKFVEDSPPVLNVVPMALNRLAYVGRETTVPSKFHEPLSTRRAP